MDIRITEISEEMHRLLLDKKDGLVGGVHSVFLSACNIMTTGGRLLTIQQKDVAESPMSIVLSDEYRIQDLELSVGTVVYLSDLRLIAGNLRFLWIEAAAFSSRFELLGTACSEDCLNDLQQFLLNDPDSLYFRMNSICSQDKSTSEAVLTLMLEKGLRQIEDGFICKDLDWIKQGIKRIVGLGAGLTPTGDDVLMGLFTALSIRPEHAALIYGLEEFVLSHARKNTTTVSYEFFYYFFRQRYVRPIGQLLSAMQTRDIIEYRRKFGEVSQIGHSSGRDFLTGLCRGLSLTGSGIAC